MKKTQVWKYTCLGLCMFFIVGCQQSLERPFTISNAKVLRSSTGACYKIAGIEFSLYNGRDEQVINKLQVSGRLYAVSKTGSGSAEKVRYRAVPVIGKNTIKRVIEVSIAGKERGSVCVGLDDMLPTVPSDKLLVKPFYIEQVSYDSGAVWKDVHGTYRQGIAE